MLRRRKVMNSNAAWHKPNEALLQAFLGNHALQTRNRMLLFDESIQSSWLCS